MKTFRTFIQETIANAVGGGGIAGMGYGLAGSPGGGHQTGTDVNGTDTVDIQDLDAAAAELNFDSLPDHPAFMA